MNRTLAGVLLFATLLVLFIPMAVSQTATATISGRVSDPTGAAVPNVAVKVRNVNTGFERTAATNEAGLYVFELLPPSEYEVSATMEGFRTFVRSGIVLQIDQKSRQDITLAIGSTQEQVEVTAAAEQFLKAESSELGEVIGQKTIEDLPLNGRGVLNLISLNAGVSSTTNSFFKGVGVDFSLNGQRSSTNAYLIDGMDNVEFGGQAPNNDLQVDAVQEFNILTDNFQAEYGRSAGGVINVSMRSGTNQIHGTLFEFFRNDKLDATDFFTNRVGGTKLPFRFNQYGGSLGGPIVRNKTFFFVAYQGTRSRTGNTAIVSVPLTPWRGGDFSSLLSENIQLYDPTNVNGQAGDFPARTPFPNNIIPADKQSTVGSNLVNLYPAPNLPGRFFNYTRPIRNATNRHQFDIKLDHYFSENDILTGRWNYSDSGNTSDSYFGDYGGGPVPKADVSGHNMGIAYTHIFSPTILNETRFGYVRRVGDTVPSGFGQDLNTQNGLDGLNVDENTSGLAFLIPNGFEALGSQVFFPQLTTLPAYQILNNTTIHKGRHALKFGVDYHRRAFDLYQAGFPRGFFVFDGLFTSQAFAGGNPIADFLMGYPTFAQRDVLNHVINQRGWELSWFAQDTIRVNQRLTLNLGVRYDLFTPLLEAEDRQSNFNLTTKVMDLAGQNGVSRRLLPMDKNNYAPRIGFAYTLTSDQRTILRGGYGISYFAEANALGTLDRSTYNIPFYYLQTFAQASVFNPIRDITTALPNLPAPDPSAPFGKVGYRAPTLRDSYSQTWNLDLQRTLSQSTVLDFAYAGSRGVHLLGVTNPNQPAPGPVRIFPISPAIGQLFTMDSRSNLIHHSMQVKLNRRLAQGLMFLGSYTWGKTIDDTVGYWPNSGVSQLPQDSRNFGKAERGRSDWDIRHRFVLSYSWELPFGRGRSHMSSANAVAEAVLGGWQMSGITTLSTGTPFTVLMGANRANTAFGGNLRPTRVADGSLPDDERTIDRWFDKKAFALADVFTFGNSGRNILDGPGMVNFDWGMFKNFRFTERVNLQFRAEFFNLFNTPHFGLPNAFMDQAQGGVIRSLSTPPRQIQIGLKITF